ncbi:DNA polymerase V [Desulfobaculum xiamenense]|uniref:DNA polymerase V n=1 Tax=Desulfobaculum xiamenense TaxID=995050 RepID=A0A846QR32_9BACT|nr:translesion error-prone DNA polymerase V autoproteolytic subunit [Desulfobaculum xiamenense]NJB68833.1 DNA polymerase V [Desulfobaculum xiamenense]
MTRQASTVANATPTRDSATPPATPAALRGNEILGFEKRSALTLPLHLEAVAAGFPSPANDFIERTIDLNEHLVRHPAATFFVRVHGDSMIDARLQDGDVIVVDRAVDVRDNHVVVAALDGELTVKRIRRRDGKLWLMPENPEYPPFEVAPERDFEVWGVVTYVIHKL